MRHTKVYWTPHEAGRRFGRTGARLRQLDDLLQPYVSETGRRFYDPEKVRQVAEALGWTEVRVEADR